MIIKKRKEAESNFNSFVKLDTIPENFCLQKIVIQKEVSWPSVLSVRVYYQELLHLLFGER